MKKNFLFLKNDVLFKRIFSIRKSIISYSLASLLDIFVIIIVSSIFSKIASANQQTNIFQLFSICLILILFRTIAVFLLRKYAFNRVFYKKLIDEKLLVHRFIENRFKKDYADNNDLKLFKEKIINSSNLAATNFDIPFFSIVAEIIFALGGIFILFKIFGFKLLLLNLPIFIILIIFSKFVSRKLNKLGRQILSYSEKRLNIIDNVSEIAIELAALEDPDPLVSYFNRINKPFNQILNNQTVTSNMTQIYTESAAFIIILICLVCLITNITNTTTANTATCLIVLSRLVPSFTRSVCFITQLQFGVPCVRELSKIYKYQLK